MSYQNERLIQKTEDAMTISIFRPSLFRLLPENCGTLSRERHIKLRFFYRYLVGYQMFLLRNGEEFIAYAMFQKGRIMRYPFVEKNMLLMGPYFVEEEQRGHSYAGVLVKTALQQLKDYKAVFAWIVASNEPSRRAVTKLGFERVSYLDTSHLIKRVVSTQTNHELWRKDLDKEGKS